MKIVLNKIDIITTPTIATKNLSDILRKKYILLRDPIIFLKILI